MDGFKERVCIKLLSHITIMWRQVNSNMKNGSSNLKEQAECFKRQRKDGRDR